MWPRRPDAPLWVGLSSSELCWQRVSDEPHCVPLNLDPTLPPVQAVAAAAAAALEPMACKSIYVVVGSSLARHWLQQVPPGLRSLAELQALAQSRAELLFGAGTAWSVAADWHATEAFFCAAVPTAVQALPQGWCTGARAQLSTTWTHVLASQARRVPDQTWVLSEESGTLHLLYVDRGLPIHYSAVQLSESVSTGDKQALMQATLAQVAARGGGLPTAPVTLLPAAADAGWSQARTALHFARHGAERLT